MANIGIRDFDDRAKQALARRAREEGCSLSALLRRLLEREVKGAAETASAAKGAGASAAGGVENALAGRRILLLLGGSVAVYKGLEFIRLARARGARVETVMTKAAQHFITPLAAGALSGGGVYTDLFSRAENREIGHIALARGADIIVFIGVSASRMGKMAAGLADDLAGAALLAARAPVLLAPAMNPAMWAHPAARRNAARLKADGYAFIGPERGEMAEANEAGEGRMSEAEDILAAAAEILQKGQSREAEGGLRPPEGVAALASAAENGQAREAGAAEQLLRGRRIVITAGPTYEAIDPVRYLANHSSGRQGYALAAACARLGAQVCLISGPVSLPAPQAVEIKRVETALEMQAAAKAALPADAAVFTAAVADWRPRVIAAQKLKKPKNGKATPPKLELTENPDILAEIAHSAARPALVIGFAAETENLRANALEKLRKKGADWIAANNVARQADGGSVMGGAENRLSIFSRAGEEEWPQMSKEQAAERLAAKIAAFFAARGSGAASKN